MSRVELQNLSKAWDTAVAVDGVDLTIENGEFVAILGPSGCGKSTLLFMLAGVYTPTGGDILFDGARVNEVEARARNIGIVFQSYALYPHMSALKNIMFPLRFKKTADAEAQAREAAELVQIETLLDRRPSELSGGQQQRVALARALVKRPNLLLLDEPLSNLDATLRMTMRAEIRRITREIGVTTVLVTHDQIEATTMADKVVCMRAGRIEQVGAPSDLYARPSNRFVAGFIGSPPINLLEVAVQGGAIDLAGLRLETDAPDGPAVLGVRPEHLRAAETGLAAQVTGVEGLGREVMTALETGFGPVRMLEPGAAPRWRAEETLHLSFDPGDAMLFDAEGRNLHATLRPAAPAHA